MLYILKKNEMEQSMEREYGMIAIGGICLVVLFMGIMKQKARAAAVFLSRAAVGVMGICVMNKILEGQNITVSVGVNPVSALTIGSLGISGFALLYGIMFYRSL